MKLTRSVGYAVGILLRVQSVADGNPMTADAMSKGCKFPPRFLYRVLRRLVDAGLLEGISGPHGGYRLARSPGEIALLEIVEAVEDGGEAGGLVPVAPAQKGAIALINEMCESNERQLREALSEVTLAKLAKLCTTPKGRKPAKGKKKLPAKPATRGARKATTGKRRPAKRG